MSPETSRQLPPTPRQRQEALRLPRLKGDAPPPERIRRDEARPVAERDPDTIKQEIDLARDQLASTVDSLAVRANPRRLADDAKAFFKDRVMGKFKYVDGELAGKDYLMGKQFTVADGYMFTMLAWAERMKWDLSGLSNLMAYKARVGARPKVQEALVKEGLMNAA